MSGSPAIGTFSRAGVSIGYERIGAGPAVLLLHATLSSARQLRGLATRLATDRTVLGVDRRESGRSRLPDGRPPRPIDVGVHVADLEGLIRDLDLGPTQVVGHSFGGCLALELAARRPDLVTAVWAYEPPYAAVGSPAVRAALTRAAEATASAAASEGPAAAAEAFLAAVAGPGAVARLSPAARARIGEAGRAAIADAPLLGLDAVGLARIGCPVTIATGSASAPVYAGIADALASVITGACVVRLEGLDHMAPISRPDAIATAIAEDLRR